MSIYSKTSIPRSRIKRHAPKRRPGDDQPLYRNWIKALPCAVPGCVRNNLEEARGFGGRVDIRWSEVEAHHAGDHGYAQRPPDRTCIPLCVRHHREGPESAHVLGKKFWQHHGLDRDALIAELNARYDVRS